GLTLLTALLAVAVGFPAAEGQPRLPLADRALRLFDAWGTDGGLWDLLAFSMQMSLILVTGHALAASRPVRALIDAAAGIPRSTASAAAIVAVAASCAGLINWGLGLIVGALLARETGRSLSRRGVRAHYPLI